MTIAGTQHIDPEIFNKLFEAYRNRVYGFVLSITHSAYSAEEITQEIFIKIWLSADLMDKTENLEPYLFTMVRNRTVSYLRKAACDVKLLRELQGQMKTDINPAENKLAIEEYNKLIQKAVGQLTSRREAVYRLSREKGMTLDEIAASLHISRNTAKNHLVDALRFIRNFLLAHHVEFLLLFFLYS